MYWYERFTIYSKGGGAEPCEEHCVNVLPVVGGNMPVLIWKRTDYLWKDT